MPAALWPDQLGKLREQLAVLSVESLDDIIDLVIRHAWLRKSCAPFGMHSYENGRAGS